METGKSGFEQAKVVLGQGREKIAVCSLARDKKNRLEVSGPVTGRLSWTVGCQ